MIYGVSTIKLDYSKIDAPVKDRDAVLKVYVSGDNEELARFGTKRPLVLVLPGGGYGFTSEREAEPIAMNFVAKGINAAVLYYNVAPGTVFPIALIESLCAIKYIRENAEKFLTDPDKISVCGFSAGGHLAASVGTLWNGREARKYFDDVNDVKPNGLILSYPVITNDFDGDKRIHKGSFNNLLGDKKDDKELLEYLCLDRRVSRDTPPTFIWSTFEDTCVPCESTLKFACALRKCGIPFELHIYEKGEHGGATGDRVTCDSEMRLKNWMNEAVAWVNTPRSKYIEPVED